MSLFDRPGATVCVLTAADATLAAQAITLMDHLINRQRDGGALGGVHSDRHLRIGRSPALRCLAGRTTRPSRKAWVCRTIRDVTPVMLIMYGSHQRELMESSAFKAGKATRSDQVVSTDTGSMQRRA